MIEEQRCYSRNVCEGPSRSVNFGEADAVECPDGFFRQPRPQQLTGGVGERRVSYSEEELGYQDRVTGTLRSLVTELNGINKTRSGRAMQRAHRDESKSLQTLTPEYLREKEAPKSRLFQAKSHIRKTEMVNSRDEGIVVGPRNGLRRTIWKNVYSTCSVILAMRYDSRLMKLLQSFCRKLKTHLRWTMVEWQRYLYKEQGLPMSSLDSPRLLGDAILAGNNVNEFVKLGGDNVSQAYSHASSVIQSLGETDISVNFWYK